MDFLLRHRIGWRERLAVALAAATAVACMSAVGGPASQAAGCLPSTLKKPPRNRVLRVGTYGTNSGKKGQCATIQEAVHAAAPGNWILIGPGDYKQTGSTKPAGAYGEGLAGAAVLV